MIRWVQKSPQYGDTVKVEFSDWTNLGTQTGVCVGFCDRGAKIQFGNVIRNLSGTFFVLEVL